MMSRPGRVVAAVAVVLSGASAWCQTMLGPAWTYQGSLQMNGAPVDSPGCDFEFSLWDAAAGGGQVGQAQSLAGVAVTDGLFTVTLNGNGEFGPAAFNGDERFLQIAVACPSGGALQTLGPRQAITGAPYAQFALTGTIAPNSVGSAEVVDGALTGADIAANAITGAHIAPGTISGADVGSNTLTGANIHMLTGADIIDGSITSADVASLAPGKLSPAPFQFEMFTVGGSGVIGTRWVPADWVVAIVGFQARNGDIQENGVGDPVFVYPYVNAGQNRWEIIFDFRSHNTHESWRIWAMAVRREMTVLHGGYGNP